MQYIGNANCKHNARSPYLRCAVNPCGPCEGCPSYSKASLGERLLHPVWGIDSDNTEIVKDKMLRFLIGTFAGIQLGVFLAGFVIIPTIKQATVKTHLCLIQSEANRYCEK